MELIVDWLNTEVGLSRPITSLEDDFRNGYLLGEVLFKHNQQPNFNLFMAKSTPDARINNFCLLEPTFRALNVKFDSKIAFDIMQGVPGVVTGLLYEIQMRVRRLRRGAPKVSMKERLSGGREPLVNARERMPKPRFEEARHTMFENSIRKMIENPNDLLAQHATQRFLVEGDRQRAEVNHAAGTAMQEFELEMEDDRAWRQQMREQERDFVSTWERANMLKWRENQKRAKERKQRDLDMRRTMAITREQRKTAQRTTEIDRCQSDIDAFETRLRTSIPAPGEDDKDDHSTAQRMRRTGSDGAAENAGPEVDMTVDQNAMYQDFDSNMSSIRERKQEEAALAVLRERRRRRFVREMEESLLQEYQADVTSVISEQLSRSCHWEGAIDADVDHVLAYRGVLVDNRCRRTEQYHAMRAEEVNLERVRDHHALDLETEKEFPLTVSEQSEKLELANAARENAVRAGHENFCRAIAYRIAETAMNAVELRTYLEMKGAPLLTVATEVDFDATEVDFDDEASHDAASGVLLTDDTPCPIPIVLLGKDDPAAIPSLESNIVPEAVWRAQQHVCIEPELPVVPGVLDSYAFQRPAPPTADQEAKEEGEDDAEGSKEEKTDEEEDEAVAAAAAAAQALKDVVPGSLDENVAAHLNDRELTDYLQWAEDWTHQVATQLGPNGFSAGDDEASVEADSSAIAAEKEALDGGNTDSLSKVAPCYAVGESAVDISIAAEPLRSAPVRPNVPEFAMRACVCGRSHTGRSTQTARLCDEFHLKRLSLDKLTALAVHAAQRSLRGEERATVSLDSGNENDWDHASLSDPDLLAIGLKLYESLASGGQSSDELMAQLVLWAIRQVAAENERVKAAHVRALEEIAAKQKQYASAFAEYERRVQERRDYREQLIAMDEYDEDEVDELVCQQHGPSEPPAPEPLSEEEATAPELRLWRGWVLEDFPETADQARALVRELSAVDLREPLPCRLERQSTIAPAKAVDPPRHDVSDVGLDCVLYLEDDMQNVVERCFGRRLDAVTSVEYHLKSKPPPRDTGEERVWEKRLFLPKDPARNPATLGVQLAAHDSSRTELCSFFDSLNVLTTVSFSDYRTTQHEGAAEAGVDFDSVYNVMSETVGTVLVQREEAAQRAAEEEAARAAEEKAAAEALVAAELESRRLAAIEAAKTPEEREAEAEAKAAAIQAAEEAGEPLPDDEAHERPPPKPLVMFRGPVYAQIGQRLGTLLMAQWSHAENSFMQSANALFLAMREMHFRTFRRVHNVRHVMRSFLLNGDDKQLLLEKFRREFNVDVTEDMRFDADSKNELHLRCEELREQLWARCETKEAAARKQMRSIRRDGWVEAMQHWCRTEFASMMQAEVDRHHASMQVLADYHAAVNGEGPEGALVQVAVDSAEADAFASGKAGPAAAAAAAKGGGGKGGKGGASLPPSRPLNAHLHTLVGVRKQEISALVTDEESTGFAWERPEDEDDEAGGDAKGKDAKKGGKGKGKGSVAGGAGGANDGEDDNDAGLDLEAGMSHEELEVHRDGFLTEIMAASQTCLQPWSRETLALPSLETVSVDMPPAVPETMEAAIEPEAGVSFGYASSADQAHAGLCKLYRAMWYETDLTTARLQRLLARNRTMQAWISQCMRELYAQLYGELKKRIDDELTASQSCVLKAQLCVEAESPIEHDWLLEGTTFQPRCTVRIVPEPELPPVPQLDEEKEEMESGERVVDV